MAKNVIPFEIELSYKELSKNADFKTLYDTPEKFYKNFKEYMSKLGVDFTKSMSSALNSDAYKKFINQINNELSKVSNNLANNFFNKIESDMGQLRRQLKDMLSFSDKPILTGNFKNSQQALQERYQSLVNSREFYTNEKIRVQNTYYRSQPEYQEKMTKIDNELIKSNKELADVISTLMKKAPDTILKNLNLRMISQDVRNALTPTAYSGFVAHENMTRKNMNTKSSVGDLFYEKIINDRNILNAHLGSMPSALKETPTLTGKSNSGFKSLMSDYERYSNAYYSALKNKKDIKNSYINKDIDITTYKQDLAKIDNIIKKAEADLDATEKLLGNKGYGILNHNNVYSPVSKVNSYPYSMPKNNYMLNNRLSEYIPALSFKNTSSFLGNNVNPGSYNPIITPAPYAASYEKMMENAVSQLLQKTGSANNVDKFSELEKKYSEMLSLSDINKNKKIDKYTKLRDEERKFIYEGVNDGSLKRGSKEYKQHFEALKTYTDKVNELTALGNKQKGTINKEISTEEQRLKSIENLKNAEEQLAKRKAIVKNIGNFLNTASFDNDEKKLRAEFAYLRAYKELTKQEVQVANTRTAAENAFTRGARVPYQNLNDSLMTFRALTGQLGGSYGMMGNTFTQKFWNAQNSSMLYGGFSPRMLLSNLGRASLDTVRNKRYENELFKYIENSELYKFARDREYKENPTRAKSADFTVKEFLSNSKYSNEKSLLLSQLGEDPKMISKLSKAGLGTAGIIALAVAGLNKLSKGIVKLGKESVKAYQDIESFQTQLGIVFSNNMQANAMFGDISTYALKSPFGVQTMTQQAIQLRQSGTGESRLMDTLSRLGDISSGNEEKFRSISDVYSRVMASTTVTARDMRQLVTAGVPAYKELVKAINQRGDGTNISQSQVRSYLQAGKVTSEDFKKMLFNLTDKGGMFEGATDIGAKTLKARKLNLKDARQLGLAEVGDFLSQNGFYQNMLSMTEGMWGLAKNTFWKTNYKNRSDKLSDIIDAGYITINSQKVIVNEEGYSSSLSEQDALNVKEYSRLDDKYGFSNIDKILNVLNKYDRDTLWDYAKQSLEGAVNHAKVTGNYTYLRDYENFREAMLSTGINESQMKAITSLAYKKLNNDDINYDGSFTEKAKKSKWKSQEEIKEEILKEIYKESKADRYDLELSYKSKIFADSISRAVDAVDDYTSSVNGLQQLISKEQIRYKSTEVGSVIENENEWKRKQAKKDKAYNTLSNLLGYSDYTSFQKSNKNTSLIDAYNNRPKDVNFFKNLGVTGLNDFYEQFSQTATRLDLNRSNIFLQEGKDNFKKLSQNFSTVFNSSVMSYIDKNVTKSNGLKNTLLEMGKIYSNDKIDEEGLEKLYELNNLLEKQLGNINIDSVRENLKSIIDLYKVDIDTSIEGINLINNPGKASARSRFLSQLTGYSAGHIEVFDNEGKGNKTLDYYKNVIRPKKEVESFTNLLLQSGRYNFIEIGKVIGSSFNKKAGTLDWEKASSGLQGIYKFNNIEEEQALLSVYQNMLTEQNSLFTSALTNQDDLTNVHDILKNSVSTFNLSVDSMKDASGKFVDGVLDAIDEYQKGLKKNISEFSLDISKKRFEKTYNDSLRGINLEYEYYGRYGSQKERELAIAQRQNMLSNIPLYKASLGYLSNQYYQNLVDRMLEAKKKGIKTPSNIIDDYLTDFDNKHKNDEDENGNKITYSTKDKIESFFNSLENKPDISDYEFNLLAAIVGLTDQTNRLADINEKIANKDKELKNIKQYGNIWEGLFNNDDKLTPTLYDENLKAKRKELRAYKKLSLATNLDIFNNGENVNPDKFIRDVINGKRESWSLNQVVNALNEFGTITEESEAGKITKYRGDEFRKLVNNNNIDEAVKYFTNTLSERGLLNKDGTFTDYPITNPLKSTKDAVKYYSSLLDEKYKPDQGLRFDFFNNAYERKALKNLGFNEYTDIGTLKYGFNKYGENIFSSVTKGSHVLSNANTFNALKDALLKEKNLNGLDAKIESLNFEQGTDEQLLKNKDNLLQYIKEIKGEFGVGELLSESALDISGVKVLKDTFVDLGTTMADAFKNVPLNAFNNGLKQIGASLYEINENGSTWEDEQKKIDKMIQSTAAGLMDQIAPAMTTAGLALIEGGAKEGKAGWGKILGGMGLVAAAGIANISSGWLSAASSDTSNDDELDRLNKLKDNLAELLQQAKNDASYYEAEFRNKAAISSNNVVSDSYYKVNDMILTPQGKFSTAPDDYIIATKHPESLGGKSGTTVNFSIVNQSGSPINVTSSRQTTDDNGNVDLVVMVNNIVKKSMAEGEYDNTLSVVQARQQGYTVSA